MSENYHRYLRPLALVSAAAGLLLGTISLLSLNRGSHTDRLVLEASEADRPVASGPQDDHDGARRPIATSEHGAPDFDASEVPRVAQPRVPSQRDRTPQEHGGPGQIALDLGGARDVDHRSDWEAVAGRLGECVFSPNFIGQVQTTIFGAAQDLRQHLAQISVEQERRMGQQIHELIMRDRSIGPVNDPRTLRYLEALLVPIAALRRDTSTPLQVFILRRSEPNAFATMGGFLYVSQGLLEGPLGVRNEAELVYVLAHEVGHLDLRHVASAHDVVSFFGGRIGDSRVQLELARLVRMLESVYDRELEREADAYAYHVLRALGYSPLQAEKMWYRQYADETPRAGGVLEGVDRLLDTHPSALERACHMRELLRDAPPRGDVAYRGTRNLRDRVTAFARID